MPKLGIRLRLLLGDWGTPQSCVEGRAAGASGDFKMRTFIMPCRSNPTLDSGDAISGKGDAGDELIGKAEDGSE